MYGQVWKIAYDWHFFLSSIKFSKKNWKFLHQILKLKLKLKLKTVSIEQHIFTYYRTKLWKVKLSKFFKSKNKIILKPFVLLFNPSVVFQNTFLFIETFDLIWFQCCCKFKTFTVEPSLINENVKTKTVLYHWDNLAVATGGNAASLCKKLQILRSFLMFLN